MVLSLIEIARKKFEAYFEGSDFNLDNETKEAYSQLKACFVTITKKGELRGCAGNLQANQQLWKSVLENAMNAGFNDNRFSPLEKKELPRIKIEISVLSEPKRISYDNSDDLLKKVNNQMGIIIKKGFLSATFLPSVWKQIPFKKRFFEQLSIKAGLEKDAWKGDNIQVLSYSVEDIKED